MYCIKCGADNLETAKFCRKCGADLAGPDEVETRVAVRADSDDSRAVGGMGSSSDLHDHEVEIFSIRPTLMFVKGGYAVAGVGALLLVALFSSLFPSVPIWIDVLVGLMLFLIPAFYHFKLKLIKYTLMDTKLEIDEGFIARTTRNVPLRRIQDVTVSATVIQRMLGFGTLTIDTASEEGGKIVLKNINVPKHYAEVLLKQMRRLEK